MFWSSCMESIERGTLDCNGLGEGSISISLGKWWYRYFKRTSFVRIISSGWQAVHILVNLLFLILHFLNPWNQLNKYPLIEPSKTAFHCVMTPTMFFIWKYNRILFFFTKFLKKKLLANLYVKVLTQLISLRTYRIIFSFAKGFKLILCIDFEVSPTALIKVLMAKFTKFGKINFPSISERSCHVSS